MSKNCNQCAFYKEKMYSRNEKKPDSRCIHYKAKLGGGKFNEGDFEVYMTIREARLPAIDEKVHGQAAENFCGPDARFFKQKS